MTVVSLTRKIINVQLVEKNKVFGAEQALLEGLFSLQ